MSAQRDTLWLERLAHDLRGPLSPIKSAVFLLRRPDVGAVERGELLDMVDRQSDRLLDMVAELSAWVRCQQGAIVKRRDRIEPTGIEVGRGL